MERVISSCSAKIPCISRSYVSDQTVNPSHASISSAVTRTRLPSRRTLPSSTWSTFSFAAISASSVSLSLNQNEERRASQAINFGQRSEKFLRDPFSEICVVPLRTQIAERQNGDRSFG